MLALMCVIVFLERHNNSDSFHKRLLENELILAYEDYSNESLNRSSSKTFDQIVSGQNFSEIFSYMIRYKHIKEIFNKK